MDNNNFIDTLLSQKSENVRLRRLSEYNVETVMHSICAFLNNEGGWIIIGISDDGNKTNIDVRCVIEDIQKNATQKIKPLPLVYIHGENYKNGEVVLVTVMKGGLPPYSYDSKYFTINKNDIIEPTADEVNLLIRQSINGSLSSWEKSVCVDAELEDLNTNLINEVVNKGLNMGRLDSSYNTYEKLLGHLQLIDTPYVKNGAIALFGTESTQFLPQNRMRIQVMLRGKTANKYEDTIVMKGNMLELLKQANDYFLNRMPIVSAFHRDEWDRSDYSEYPQDVLDEAITNALIHRDMSDRTGEVIVFIYEDRIEVINPGVMPDNFVKKKNVIRPHISSPRNPLMAEIFYIDGKMEKTGRGLTLIHDQMVKLNRKLPEWECSNGKTKLTIYRIPSVTKLNDRASQFLSSMGIDKIFSKKDYLQYWNYEISDRTAKNDLQAMVNSKLCQKIGAGPSIKYLILKLPAQ